MLHQVPTIAPFFPDNPSTTPDGLFAVGGDLHSEMLLEAYQKGYFPWFSELPVLWFDPPIRMIIYPDQIQINKRDMRDFKNLLNCTSKKKEINIPSQSLWRVELGCHFAQVIHHCAKIKRSGDTSIENHSTWINPLMISAYQKMYQLGYAWDVAVFVGEELVGGLYGILLGKIFCGESMFSRHSNSSKLALWALCQICIESGVEMIDCQMPTNHLQSLGGIEMPKKNFKKSLNFLVKGKSRFQDFRGELEVKKYLI